MSSQKVPRALRDADEISLLRVRHINCDEGRAGTPREHSIHALKAEQDNQTRAAAASERSAVRPDFDRLHEAIRIEPVVDFVGAFFEQRI